MNRRTARKILRDPMRHNAHRLLLAARRVRPVWFREGDEACTAAYNARSALGRDHNCPAERRRARWQRIWWQGQHDRCRRIWGEIPF